MKAEDIKKVGLVGGGLIGASFALAFAMGGIDASLYSRSEKTINEGKDIVRNSLNQLVEMGVISREESENIASRISYTTSLEVALKDAQYVQESLAENYEIKQKVLHDVEALIGSDVPIGSSTSGLKITEISKFAEHPERIFVAHPWNPPHLIPLIELGKGEKTEDKYIELAKDLFKRINKEPIVLQKEVLGFVGNRIQAAVIREVLSLVFNGVVSMEDADKAVTFGPGIRWGIMGPGLILNLGGGLDGIEGFLKNIGPSVELWLKDLANWTEIPYDYSEIQKLVDESIAARDPEIGNDAKSLGEYRTKMLVEFLKLHGKL